DGITRHISDNELRDLLRSGQSPESICEQMKRRCYQRGAEDNLTAVIVQVGTPKFVTEEAERTVDAHLPELATTAPALAERQTVLTPPSRIAFPAPATTAATTAASPRIASEG